MTTPTPQQAMRVPGQLMINPATINDPSSGTSLGLVMDAVCMRRQSIFEIVAPEFGIEPVDALELGERWAFTFAVRGFDSDAMGLFASTFLGAASGVRGIRYPGTSNAGDRKSGRSVIARFTPDDPAHHPGVVIYRALPMFAEEMELAFSHDTELTVELGFLGIRDVTGRLVEVQLVEDMTP